MITHKRLLLVKNLTVHLGGGKDRFCAVDKVNFDLNAGETLALVGESGSGKTTIGRAIARIIRPSSGKILYKGRQISGRISSELDRMVTRKIQMIFQDPMGSLNERAKVDYIISEGLYNTGSYHSDTERRRKVHQAMEAVGLLPEFADRFPHEFSGGQRQRIGIARTLVMQPELIIADEPISALDISIRAQILNLLTTLKRNLNLTYLFIAHDLAMVRYIADRVAVIYRGKLVELGATEALYAQPLHPYTRALLAAIPIPNPRIEPKREVLVYDPTCHGYAKSPPHWVEIAPARFVLANSEELRKYQQELLQL